jgi:hypothetical protein
MAKKKQAKKRSRPAAMQFFNLRLNEEDLSHLRWLLDGDCQMNAEFMDAPSKGKQSLEDWVVARDMLFYSMRVIAMIDKVCPQIAKRAAKK